MEDITPNAQQPQQLKSKSAAQKRQDRWGIIIQFLIALVVFGILGVYAYLWFSVVGGMAATVQTQIQASNTPQTQVSVNSVMYDGFPFKAKVSINQIAMKQLDESKKAVASFESPLITLEFEPFQPTELLITVTEPQMSVLDKKAIGADKAELTVSTDSTSGGGRLELLMNNFSLGDLPELATIPDTFIPEVLKLQIQAIPTLPEFTFPLLTSWQAANGVVELEAFSISSPDLSLVIDGFVRLSKTLQPEGRLNYKLSGFRKIIDHLKAQGILDPKSEAFLLTALSGLWKTDPATGDLVMEGTLVAEEGILNMGGIFPLPLPKVIWPMTSDQPVEFQNQMKLPWQQ